MNMVKIKENFYLISLICFMLIFVLFFNPSDDSRMIRELLNFGHVFLFGLIALLLFKIIDKGKKLIKSRITAWIITMILGLFVEVIQLGMKDRYFELGDLLNDAIGALVFLAFFTVHTDRMKSTFIRISSVILVVLAGIPFFIALTEEIIAKQAFPVLDSFNNPIELYSWKKNNSIIKLSKDYPDKGTCAAMLTFFPGEYSTLCKEDFIHNWKGYKSFDADIYLPGKEELKIVLRINDKDHNDEFNDRFNRKLILKPGWNNLKINLDEVRMSPSKRIMDMSRVSMFCIFASRLERTQTIYLDNIRLE